MKKLLLIGTIGFLGLTACRKSYYCDCANLDGDSIKHYLNGKITEKQAQEQCDLTEYYYYQDTDFSCTPKEL